MSRLFLFSAAKNCLVRALRVEYGRNKDYWSPLQWARGKGRMMCIIFLQKLEESVVRDGLQMYQPFPAEFLYRSFRTICSYTKLFFQNDSFPHFYQSLSSLQSQCSYYAFLHICVCAHKRH